MPSQYAHAQFAADILHAIRRPDLVTPAPSWLALGAQGPDMFYHNQRTKPSGIALGSLMHRRGYGSFCATLVATALEKNWEPSSHLGQYILGFISHAILDRHLHPYINYHSGWFEPSIPESQQYRYAHAFFERIIDTYAIQGDFAPGTKGTGHRIFPGLTPPGGPESRFAQVCDLGDDLPEALESLFISALHRVYPKTREDEVLPQRIRNAYRDTMGFYRFCDQAERDRWAQWKAGALEPISSLRWVGLLHPLALPRELDVLNEQGRQWVDPCGIGEDKTVGLGGLWNTAVSQGVRIFTDILNLWEHHDSPEDFIGLAPLIGDSDLRNTFREVHLCTLTESNPLPFHEVLQVLATGPIPDDWRILV